MFDATCSIHPTAVISGDVKMGKNNQILPYTILIGPLEIGDNNIIGPHVVVGSPGQDTRNPRHETSDKRIVIGSNNIIREFTAVQKPCYGRVTTLHDDIFLMQSVHIPHDAILENNVSITPMVVMGGIVTLMEGCNIGMGASIHQKTIIGAYSIVATGSAVVKNVKPFSRYIPGKPTSVNTYMIEKFGFTEYTDEITKYVLENQAPKSERVGAIIERYEKMHLESKRDQY